MLTSKENEIILMCTPGKGYNIYEIISSEVEQLLLILFKRFLRKWVPNEAESSEPKLAPEQYIIKIRQGEEHLREQFIAEYSPYIAKVTSGFCKRYIEPGSDDEFSVAMLAFNEAINHFDSDAGKSFLGFAKTVIQRRLIDHVRKEQRHLQVVPYSMFDSEAEDQSTYNVLDTKQAMAAHETNRADTERKMEIAELSQELGKYGITFAELVELSPKHADSRMMLIGIAGTLAADANLLEVLRQTGRMPIKELILACAVSRKTIERNRKYIIAIAIIMTGAYPYMNDYLRIRSDQTISSKEVSQ
ncbi:RNA polymerase sigma factor SigI [Paenibacillus sp. L3-i20]|uniref:RNA polymerase sigma factor SigI n=1 Tax=Paenibacillus sp. L3-i20 TaxID=2905833 RepID=UPI001EE049F8|nr:RNA polymerase sigma factor SigI [Paenibacillus sp. L3-i20]GKU75901.1 RNA polymerase sigma factor SigI [Paenibacillus sp. L3-i20]